MRKLLICLLIILIGNQHLKAQNNAGAIATGVGLLATGITVAAIIEQYKELLELGATEHILANQKDITDFRLSILDFEGVKPSDLSNMTCLTFSIEKIDQKDSKTGERYVLLMFTSKGWANDNGINYSLVRYKLFTKEQWNDLFINYCNLAIKNKAIQFKSSTIASAPVRITKDKFKDNDTNFFKFTNELNTELTYQIKKAPIGECSLTSTGVSINMQNETDVNIPFAKLGGDSYLTKNYSDEFLLVYNEKTLGIYFKNMGKLTQLRRSTINKIHAFINH